MAVAQTLVVDGLIVEALFADRVRRREPVGVCDACLHRLFGRIDRTRRVTYYAMTCEHCHDEKVAPQGRLGSRPSFGRDEPRPPDPVMAAAWSARDAAVMGERDDDAA